DLLAVDHPLVAVTHRTRGERRNVRARTGLAEQLTPDLFVLGHRLEQALLLLVGAPVHDRGAAHADADDVERARHFPAGELLVDDLGLATAQAEEAVLGRPRRCRPSGLAQAGAPVV